MEKKTRKGLIYIAAVSIATSLGIESAYGSGTTPSRPVPRLVVGILVDGLDHSAVTTYASTAAKKGFGRFLADGVSITAVDYALSRGDVAAAMLLTGATPNVNGIASGYVYNRETRRLQPVVTDPSFIGNFTDETYSPIALTVSTLADEAAVASDGRSHIYAIAPTPTRAIVGAGHAGGSGVWLNDKDGRWSTTTFYKDIPAAVTDRNYKRPLSARLDTISWTGGTGATYFRYAFPRKDQDRYAKLKVSARVNQEVTDLACDYVAYINRQPRVGVVDMLTVSYTVAEYPWGTSTSTILAEQEAAYRALDAQIERLLTEIDRTVGLSNTLIYIAGIPSEEFGRPVDAKHRIPTGQFSPRRAKGLLNMYLMALHGNGEWVTGFAYPWFYLNTELAKDKGVSESTLRREAAEFLLRMSGVTEATPIDDMLDDERRLYVDAKTAGDVAVEILPGWTLTESDMPDTDGKAVRLTASTAPVYILYTPTLKPLIINTPVEATAIAPTLARTIRIRAPNAAAATPVSL